ncbi:MAG: hypothetical protein R3F56_22925 [Planctomycetota bacterium]
MAAVGVVGPVHPGELSATRPGAGLARRRRFWLRIAVAGGSPCAGIRERTAPAPREPASAYTKRQNTSVTSFARDNVFSDGVAFQLATLLGDASSGYTASLTVGIAA